jgi:cell division protein FtsN
MRWIVISLFVLNAAYFGWEFSRQEKTAQHSAEFSLPPLQGKPLVLLTERLPDSNSSAPPAPVVVKPEPSPVHREVDRVEVKKESMCWSVGPVLAVEDAESLVRNLKVEGYESVMQSLEVSREVQYWVVLPPAQTRREAMDSLRELQSKKIDSYLISSGELKNAISLGLFNKEQSAKGVLANVKEAGFNAELRQKERVQSEFWVRIPPGQAIENLQKTLQTLVTSGGDAKISKASCEMFALTQ